MRHPDDRQTIELPGIETKRGRGRPRKPDALSPAQRAKRYRDKLRDDIERARRELANGVRYRGTNGETWTGRGQRPRWFEAALENGFTVQQLEAMCTRWLERVARGKKP